MKNLQVGQMVRVTDKDFASRLTAMETMFGSGNTPDLQGRLTAVSPTTKEFALLDDNFRGAVEEGFATNEELKDSVVYYDESAGRNFHLGKDMVEVIEEEEEAPEVAEAVTVQVGDVVEAQGMGQIVAGLLGGKGRGKVIHVGGQPIVNAQVQRDYDEGLIQEVHVQEGIIYLDEVSGKDMWLADDDYEVVGE